MAEKAQDTKAPEGVYSCCYSIITVGSSLFVSAGSHEQLVEVINAIFNPETVATHQELVAQMSADLYISVDALLKVGSLSLQNSYASTKRASL